MKKNNILNLIVKRQFSTLKPSNLDNCSIILKNFLKEKKLDPVFSYENLQLDSIKSKIKSDSRDLSGIYLILNKVTLDYYVGSAATGKLYIRFSNHLIHFTGSKVVKLAVKKYNISEFAFLILELFPEIVTKENNKNLLDLEDFYLKSLLPNYNILTEAGSSFGYKHSEITRIKMKSNYSLERRMKIGNLNKGKIFSKEVRDIMKKKALTRKKVVHSEEAKLNMKKKSKPILVYNLDYTIYSQYPSIIEAAKYLNCHEKTIRRALKTEKRIVKKR
jgi:group I intron endonuclease